MGRSLLIVVPLFAFTTAACSGSATSRAPVPPPVTVPATTSLDDPREVHLRNLRQLTFGGENAEAYWSASGTSMTFQTKRPPYACDQIMTMEIAPPGGGIAEPTLVSTGKGRTTCAYYLAEDADVVYSSTHHIDDACPPEPDRSLGYVWALYDFAIFRAKADGSSPHIISDVPGKYDAEATVCAVDGSIVFTSDRDGDLELYRMNADGSNVVRLTHSPGYDGGAFFNADCSQLIWRASRPTGKDLEDYQSLLGQHLVRPSKLEIYVGDADGTNTRQVTYLDAASFAPFMSPDGKRILFSSNVGDPKGREFDIWSISPNGTNLERITYSDGFDGFPMFSADGKRLLFGSNRRDVVGDAYRLTGGIAGEHDTNVFLADWIEDAVPMADAHSPATAAADRIAADINFLADDARAGRGTGTQGLVESQDYVVRALTAAGLAPGMPDGSFLQPFEVVTSIVRGPGTKLVIDGKPVADADFVPLATSSPGPVKATVMAAGWGISRTGKGERNDYKGKRMKGRAALVHRFAPTDAALDKDGLREKVSDLEYKVFTARQAGAAAVIVVDDGDLKATEAALPELRSRMGSDAGIPVVVVTRAIGAQLRAAKSATIELTVELTPTRTTTANVVAVLRAGASPTTALPPLMIGAHLDHLGLGGENSLDGKPGIHHGADDNASGVAAVLEAARSLAANRTALSRDIWFVFFAGEEMGLLGSSYFVAHPPEPLTGAGALAMINLDMVGRMRGNQLNVLGTESASDWATPVQAACDGARVVCTQSGSGYGPSDHMSFYLAGIPVLHLFTGSHLEYHRAADQAALINAGGAARVATVVTSLATELAKPDAVVTYQKTVAPVATSGDRRRLGASLGTIPTYGGDPSAPPGVVISDVVPGGAAALAKLRGGDRLVKLGSTDVRNVEDLMFVLGTAKPGQTVVITYIRDGKQDTASATYQAPRARN